jgi:nucleoside 2-deoxyribosyltransferase
MSRIINDFSKFQPSNEELNFKLGLNKLLNKLFKGYNYNIYLAGPDVFRAEEKVKEVSKALKEVAAKYKQHGHFPLDNALSPKSGDYHSQEFSYDIFSANVKLMDDADVIIANIQPFRGPSMDDGTAFEVGYGYAKKKLIYGYSTSADLKYPEVVDRFMKSLKSDSVSTHTDEFPQIEDLGKNPVNLMIRESIYETGGKIFKTFEECVIDLTKNY